MNDKLREIALKLNSQTPTYVATFNEDDGNIVVEDSDNPEAIVIIGATESQLISITPLFNEASVKDELIAKLDRGLLTISMSMPLSSVGFQDGRYSIFGSMSINTTTENVVHEIGVQIDNYYDVIEAVSDYIQ